MKPAKAITWTAKAIQHALAVQFNFFKYCMVPNIYLGRNDEMDLAILTPSKILWEVEVKISLQDWKRDLSKTKWLNELHDHSPARFYYAVPECLVPMNDSNQHIIPDWVPIHAGVAVILNTRKRVSGNDGVQVITDVPKVRILRAAKSLHRNKLPEKYVDEMYRKLSVRYWKHVRKGMPSVDVTIPEVKDGT